MTKQEVFILNRALDGKQVFGMPSFDAMHISELLIDSYKEGMIRRGLLTDKSSLSEEGVKIVARMKDYKESDSYITMNNLTIGKTKTGKCVSMMFNPLYDEYKFTRVVFPDDFTEVVNSYDFLKDIEENEREDFGKLSKREFDEKFGDLGKNTVSLKKKSKEGNKFFTMFVKDGKAYLYNEFTGELSTGGKKAVADMLKEELL